MELEQYFKSICFTYKNSYKKQLYKKVINERIHYWFKKNQVSNLFRLKQAIKKVVPSRSKYRLFFMCGLPPRDWTLVLE
jgi:hypothetical protein